MLLQGTGGGMAKEKAGLTKSLLCPAMGPRPFSLPLWNGAIGLWNTSDLREHPVDREPETHSDWIN